MGQCPFLRTRIFACLTISSLAALGLAASDESFLGWQGMRVIKTPSGAAKITPVQLAADGAEGLLLVNTRQSRLEIFRYVGMPEKAPSASAATGENPNFLPFAEDFERVDLALPRLPLFATAYDLDGDGVDEILYVQDNPRELVELKKGVSVNDWNPTRRWEIAEGDLTTPNPILVRPGLDDASAQAFLSYRDGIQEVALEGEEVQWLQPRERNVTRLRWWLADLDEDGDLDLIEGTDSTASPIRWYEAEAESLRPAVNISTQVSRTNIGRYVATSMGPRLAFLGSVQSNTLSLYRLDRGESSPLGARNLLPLSQSAPKFWAAFELNGKRSLAELGAQKPTLNVYQEIDGFWQFLDSFPVLDDVEEIIALNDSRQTLLFRVTDETRVFRSSWADGRFSFPLPLEALEGETKAEKILAMGRAEECAWWVERAKDSLRLKVLAPDADAPAVTVFPEVEGEFEAAAWIGGQRLLLKRRFSQDTELLTLEEGAEGATLAPSRLKGNELSQLQRSGETLYLLKDGVVQKLDRNLQVIDQIMLEGDHVIASFVPNGTSAGYALDTTGEEVFVLEADESGILREIARHEVPFANRVTLDPVLGLTLISSNYINLPSAGQPRELLREYSLDPTEEGVRTDEETTFSNLFVIDADGNGTDDVAAVDFGKRTINLYELTAEGFEEMISWKVFDDGKYPYGADSGQTNTGNPYRMVALDLDGDGLQDLALASHDRLLLYLARDPQE
jgi:hypothetical protein